MAETNETKKRDVTLNPSRIGLAEQLRQDWVVNAEQGTEIRDVLEPAYWAHCAQRMQPYDRIEVRQETGDWLLELLVLDLGRNWARVHVLHKHELAPVSDTMPVASLHKVEWKGPQHKHSVIRLSDSVLVKDGFADKLSAMTWMGQHEGVIAR
jgi:hypothetical protein